MIDQSFLHFRIPETGIQTPLDVRGKPQLLTHTGQVPGWAGISNSSVRKVPDQNRLARGHLSVDIKGTSGKTVSN